MPRDYRRSRRPKLPASAEEVVFGKVGTVTRKHAWQVLSPDEEGNPRMGCTRKTCSKRWYPDQTEASRGNCKGK